MRSGPGADRWLKPRRRSVLLRPSEPPQMTATPALRLMLVVVLALAGRAWAAPAAEPAAAIPDLRPDPAVHYGGLPSGFRYAIRPQPVPPGRLSLCLHVAAGSRLETTEELGYAHFVEHMAFAGSADFPGDAAIRTLQRYGLSFGPDLNASTGRTYTTYEVRNLPADDPAALATALRVLRNFVDAPLYEPAAVERERGVILSERSVREGRTAYWWGRQLEFLKPSQDQLGEDEIAGLFGDTPLGRPEIGTPRSVKRAQAADLRAFHDRWYRPERMVLAVAGELDLYAVERAVRAEFGRLQIPSEPAPAEPPMVWPELAGRLRPEVFSNDTLPMENVTLLAAVPRSREVGTEERGRDDLAAEVAMAMLKNRISRSLTVPAQVEALLCHEVPGCTIPVLRLKVAPAGWEEAANTLGREVARALQHGFTSAEMGAAAESWRRRAQWAERDAPNRPSAEVAVALAHACGQGILFSAAAEERRWGEAVVAALTPGDCTLALERLWPEATTRLVMTGPVVHDWFSEYFFARSFARLRTLALEASVPQAAQAAVVLPAIEGTPARVANEAHVPELDCWLVEYDNGVRLNFRATPYEQERVRVRIGFGHGLMGTEPGREGLAFALAALLHGGIVGLSHNDEQALLEGQGIDMGSGFGADRLGLWAGCQTAELETVLQVFALHLLRPAFEPGGEALTRSQMDEALASYDHTAAGVADNRLREYVFGGHHALTRPRREQAEQLGYAELEQWIRPQLAASPLEITVVGDIGLDEVKEAVARTFGRLKPRPTIDPMADRRLFSPGRMPQRLEVRFDGRQNVGSVAFAWRIPDVVGQEDDCRMQLLAGILEDRVRVRLRQQMGKTYTPVVGLQSERALAPATLLVRCRVETAPRYLERVAEAARAVVAELVRDGITDDELARARPPLIRQAEDNLASNKWWLHVLGEAQSKPQYLEGQCRRAEILRATNKGELDALARLVFDPARLCEVRALPE